MTKKAGSDLNKQSNQTERLEKDMRRAHTLFSPHLGSARHMLKHAGSVQNLASAFPRWDAASIEQAMQTQEKLYPVAVEARERFEPLMSTAEVFSVVAGQFLPVAQSLKGIIFDFPLGDIQKSLKLMSGHALKVTSFNRVESSQEYILKGHVTKSYQYADIGYSASSNVELRLSSIDQKLDDLSEGVGQKNKNKNKAEIKQVLITEVTYSEAASTITVNHKDITLKKYKNESLLCNVVLGDPLDLSRVWDLEEVVEAMGESFDHKIWSRVIYDKVRQINKKISEKTGVKDFFIPSMRFVQINPSLLTEL